MKEKSHIHTGPLKSLSKITLKHLLIAALILHLTAASATYLSGRLRWLPDTFDSNGIGTSFAIDSNSYREEIINLVEALFQHGPTAWLAAPGGLHVKLYSLCFAIFHPLFGYTTLSAEPLNAIYYLLILILVFALGREIFDRSVGMLAAAIIAVWPSFLLHTTQLLRDPFFIALMLALVLICSLWLKRVFPPLKGLALGLAGALIVCTIWLLRSQMWEVVQAIALFTVALLIIRQLRERRWLAGNLLGAFVLLIIIAGVPRVADKFQIYSFPINEDAKVAQTTEDDVSLQSSTADSPANKDVEPPLPPGAGLQARIARIRHRSAKKYPEAGSNIDTDVAFNSKADIVRYLPRAAAIGFFSPFPNIWFVAGAQVGLKGRVLCGLETAIMYPLEILAVLGLWYRRRQLTAWLLALVVAAGLTALGLVIVNIAVLYRMRYVFWILIIILSVEGLMRIFPRLFLRKAPEAA